MKTNLKRIKLKQFIYPVIFLAVFGAIGFIIYKTITYAEQVSDGIFYNENFSTTNLVHINFDDYHILAVKLGIPEYKPDATLIPEISTNSASSSVASATSSIPAPEVVSTSTTQVVSSTVPEIVPTSTADRSLQKIFVYNATPKKGVAKTLADTLNQAGFTNTTIGNSAANLKTTVIEADPKAVFYNEIKSIIANSYPNFIESATGTEAVTIYIGG